MTTTICRSDVELCPHCHQPLPPAAKDTKPEPATLICEYCTKKADFIINGESLCLEHREKLYGNLRTKL